MILMPPEGAPEVMRARFERERAGVTAKLAAVVGPALASAPGARRRTQSSSPARCRRWPRSSRGWPCPTPSDTRVERMLEYARWALRLFAIEPA